MKQPDLFLVMDSSPIEIVFPSRIVIDTRLIGLFCLRFFVLFCFFSYFPTCTSCILRLINT